MEKKKRIPIGIEFYKQMVEKDYYYVDKTLLIKDILDQGGQVTLFTRPRRFGKTLALTMLRTFFEAEMDRKGERKDNSHYFDGTKIMAAGEEYTRHIGQYPVIFLSLKSAKQPTFEMAYLSLVDVIINEYERHSYVLQSTALSIGQKELYTQIMNRRAEDSDYAKAIAFLSKCLEQHHGKKTVILLDEYDVPLENAYFEGFYDRMISFIRSLFESALKTNDSLELAVITGCLRISRESIFTGLNNLRIISVLNDHYAEYFGFVQDEVDAMLDYYGIAEKGEEVKKWYDGYLFGSTEVYNPWSVINYVDSAVSQAVSFPRPYWSNTSSNSIVRELIQNADSRAKAEIEHLISGGTIEKQIHEEITYGDIHQSQDNLWNFLFFTGYLKAVSQRFEVDTIYLTMKIPNAEIGYIYRNTIREWFEQRIKAEDFTPMYRAVLEGDDQTFESIVKRHLSESISYFDSEERFYHGFLLGLLSGLQNYDMLSDRESGDGRPDIELKPYDEQKPAVIIEIKHVKQFPQMENGCREALRQIEEKRYADGLVEEGYAKVVKYGVCFCRKSCKILRGE
ncbi:MAG TPA: ATP-binding protein [Candidatus Mediterraneibacter caccavium]|uniref:ATP-binding protein n=1 Tax=Candidatus Mediterraneibacter caccavium TaxID=2838661 RepID=A0A9D2ARK9_9FIRM|nr:ATP-binding protein [Candidatus Mediterraneibacter caccavium]